MRPARREWAGPHGACSSPPRTRRSFAEIVEPVIGRPIAQPQPLGEALETPRHMLAIDATLEALEQVLELTGK